MNEECKIFWHTYLQEVGLPTHKDPLEIFCFSENKETADELAKATISGIKTGTASLLWEMEKQGVGIPQNGDLSLVTYGNGKPACVIETINVNIIPFNEVSAEFAATEGETDPSLAYWRKCHWREFAAACEQLGWEANETMPVICEEIKVVYS